MQARQLRGETVMRRYQIGAQVELRETAMRQAPRNDGSMADCRIALEAKQARYIAGRNLREPT